MCALMQFLNIKRLDALIHQGCEQIELNEIVCGNVALDERAQKHHLLWRERIQEFIEVGFV